MLVRPSALLEESVQVGGWGLGGAGHNVHSKPLAAAGFYRKRVTMPKQSAFDFHSHF